MSETLEKPAAKAALNIVGTRPIRPDGADKVTGRAAYGADFAMPGQLVGRVLRSPHAHARIVSIDASKAKALPGVKAVVTAADFPNLASEELAGGEAEANLRDLSLNVMARDKVLYHGHAVAAVAATSPDIAEAALAKIKVTYEVLPHVIDVEEAIKEWRRAEILPSAVGDRIHKFHKERQEIFKQYNYLEPMLALARAVTFGFIELSRVPADLQPRVKELQRLVEAG